MKLQRQQATNNLFKQQKSLLNIFLEQNKRERLQKSSSKELLSKLPTQSLIKQKSKEYVCNCSLMSYDTLISGTSTKKEALDVIKGFSDVLYNKTGGVICASGYNISVELNKSQKVYRIPIKWVLPLQVFSNGQIDPEEIATWIYEVVPPAFPEKMESTRGIYVDVDLSILRNTHHKITGHFECLEKRS